jgi:polyhydroxybutyrate depolymerase
MVESTMPRHFVLAFAALASGLAAAGPSNAEPVAMHPSCQPAGPQSAGLHTLRLETGGAERAAVLFVPRSYDGATAVPLVLDLHASSITPAVELAITGLDRAAEEHGFLVALPLAIRPFERGGTTWNLPHDPAWPDDVAFVATVLDAIEAALCVDPSRIFATGFSGGARLASELACRLPERIAAISAVAGLRGPDPDCPPAADPVPVLAFHGLADPVNPYDGDPRTSPKYWTHGIPEAVGLWRRWLGCGETLEASSGNGVTRLDASCGGRTMLRLYTLEAAGHTWPGSAFAFPAYTGASDASLDATALTLDWFAQHPKHRSVAASALPEPVPAR